MIDKTKTLKGKYKLELMDELDAPLFSVENLKHDTVEITPESKVWNEELEDGAEESGHAGKKVTVEATFSEFDPADMDSIEDASVAKAVITFLDKAKEVVISAPDLISVGGESKKTKVTIVKSGGIGTAWADLITVQATA